MHRLIAVAAVALSACASLAAAPADPCAGTADPCVAIERGDGGTPVIQARVNGQGPFAFVLDTAASSTSLDEDALKRLGAPRDEATEKAQGMGGEFDVRLYRVASVEGGPLVVKDFIAPGVPPPDLDSHPVMGLGGIDLFGDRLTVWQPRKGRVLLAPGGSLPEGSGWTEVKVDWIRPWKVMLPVEIAGAKGWALLDTGAQYTTLNPAYAKAVGLTRESGRLRPGGDIAGLDGKPMALDLAETGPVAIGPWRWPSRTLRIGDLPVFQRLGDPAGPLMILGIDWLQETEFAVDYKSQRVWLRDAQSA